jgi:hypothetical protein
MWFASSRHIVSIVRYWSSVTQIAGPRHVVFGSAVFEFP